MSLRVLIPIVLYALLALTWWSPFKRPPNWIYPDGSPEQRKSPEGAEYLRKLRMFQLAAFVALMVWFTILNLL